MGWLDQRRHRWSRKALERIWATESPGGGPGLGPVALARALKESESVKHHYRELVEAEVALRASLGVGGGAMSPEDREILGLPTKESAADDVNGRAGFEARVHLYLSASTIATSTSKVWPLFGVIFATAAVVAIWLLLFGRGGVDGALTADMARDQEWRVRGVGTPAPELVLSGLCLDHAEGGPLVTSAQLSEGTPLRCALDSSLQVTLDDPSGRGLSVAMFVAQPGREPLPFGPTPSASGAVMLQPVVGPQAVGPPRRLAVNLNEGAWRLVVLVSEMPLEYSVLKRSMKTWSQLALEPRFDDTEFSRVINKQGDGVKMSAYSVALHVGLGKE